MINKNNFYLNSKKFKKNLNKTQKIFQSFKNLDAASNPLYQFSPYLRISASFKKTYTGTFKRIPSSQAFLQMLQFS